jgi:hypothetical protein
MFPRDVVFAVDISGSMEGVKLEAAKLAVITALRGLDAGDRFRLIAFDTRIEVFSPRFTDYTQENLAEAERWIRRLRSRGGTEILRPLVEALGGADSDDRLRMVVLITDGQASNEAELLRAVVENRRNARLFTVGIDTAVNAALLKRLAQAGDGTCELLTPRDNIEEAIIELDARFGSPLIRNLHPDGVEAARPAPAALFAGRSVSFLIEGALPSVEVTGTTPAGEWKETVAPASINFTLGPLWARERVGWLEDRIILEPDNHEKLEGEIRQVALKHGIASRFTAFVAVETVRSHDGERVVVVQPAELPEEWSEEFLTAPAMLCRMSQAPAASHLFAKAFRRMGPGLSERRLVRAFVSHLDLSDDMADLAEEPATESRNRKNPGIIITSRQRSDGSFDGDVGRTAAAVVALLLLGNTRKAGVYRRFVMKALRWLEAHRGDARAALALRLVERVESGGQLPTRDEVEPLTAFGPEGSCLKTVLDEPAKPG